MSPSETLTQQSDQPPSLLFASLLRLIQTVRGQSASHSIPTPASTVVCYSSQICAAQRALETALPESERLFTDPYAKLLAGPEAMARAKERSNSKESAKSFKRRIGVRTRYFDDFTENALVSILGPSQLVILGCGMDTRPLRLPAVMHHVSVFEVDQQSVLETKERLLETLVPVPVSLAAVHKRVKADVAGDWAKVLEENGFEKDVPTVWVIEGLLYYLTIERVNALMRSVCRLSAPGSSFCFSAVRKLGSTRKGLARLFKSAIPEPERFVKKFGFRLLAVDQLGGVNANYGKFEDAQSYSGGTIYVSGIKD